MKCNSCQEPLDEGSMFCPHCWGFNLNTPPIVLCPGKPTNLCGAELHKSFKFCRKCGTAVDPSLFGKKRKVCTNCGNAFTKDGEKFCAHCGSLCQDGRTTSPDEIKKRPSEKVDDNNDSKAVVQIEKTGATSLKSESGHLASSNSPVSSKANDKEKKPKKEKKMKGKKSESPDKDKKEDQEYEEKKKGIEEKGEHTSQIKTSTSWSSEKEDISEATQYPKQVKAKPEAEKLKLDTNTDSSKRFPSFSSRGPYLLFSKTGGISSSINKTGGQGIKKDAVRVHFHAIISSEFGLVDEDKVIVRFGEQKLGGWAYNEYKCTLVRYMEDDYREFELHMNIPKEIFFQSGKKIEYKYVVCKDAVKKNTKYVWENYSTQCVQDTNRIIAMRENQAAVGLYASEN